MPLNSANMHPPGWDLQADLPGGVHVPLSSAPASRFPNLGPSIHLHPIQHQHQHQNEGHHLELDSNRDPIEPLRIH